MKTSLLPFLLILPLSAACAHGGSASHDGDFISRSRWPENIDLPPTPDSVELPEGIPEGEWSERAVCDGKDGVCVSPALAARLYLYQRFYGTLRKRYEADRQVWRTHRTAYEGQLEVDRETIEALQPTWWDSNKLWIGLLGGIVIGSGSAAAVLYLSR